MKFFVTFMSQATCVIVSEKSTKGREISVNNLQSLHIFKYIYIYLYIYIIVEYIYIILIYNILLLLLLIIIYLNIYIYDSFL